jgi:hypothetical protein
MTERKTKEVASHTCNKLHTIELKLHRFEPVYIHEQRAPGERQ